MSLINQAAVRALKELDAPPPPGVGYTGPQGTHLTFTLLQPIDRAADRPIKTDDEHRSTSDVPCPCDDPQLCARITGPLPEKELFVYHVGYLGDDREWLHYDWEV